MRQERGILALTEQNGCDAILGTPGSCSMLHGNTGSPRRVDPAQCSQQDCPFHWDVAALIPIRGAATTQ